MAVWLRLCEPDLFAKYVKITMGVEVAGYLLPDQQTPHLAVEGTKSARLLCLYCVSVRRIIKECLWLPKNRFFTRWCKSTTIH